MENKPESRSEREAHPCAIECQRKVHKGYPRCVDAGQCDYGKQYAESDPEGHRQAQADGEHDMTPEAQFEDICDELQVQMAPHLYEAVRVFAARLSAPSRSERLTSGCARGPNAQPHIQWNHVDGPLLVMSDGAMHWLTWLERLCVLIGWHDTHTLERKHWDKP